MRVPNAHQRQGSGDLLAMGSGTPGKEHTGLLHRLLVNLVVAPGSCFSAQAL